MVEHHFHNSVGKAHRPPGAVNLNGLNFHHDLRSQFSPALTRVGIIQDAVSDNVFGARKGQNHIGILMGGAFDQAFPLGVKRFEIITDSKITIKSISLNLFRTAKGMYADIAFRGWKYNFF